MLTTEMSDLINTHTAGMVASINDDGTPSVSPKATFFIADNATINFANIRSPSTVKTIRARPAVEVSFLDVVHRKAVRMTGTAEMISSPAYDRGATEEDLRETILKKLNAL